MFKLLEHDKIALVRLLDISDFKPRQNLKTSKATRFASLSAFTYPYIVFESLPGTNIFKPFFSFYKALKVICKIWNLKIARNSNKFAKSEKNCATETICWSTEYIIYCVSTTYFQEIGFLNRKDQE